MQPRACEPTYMVGTSPRSRTDRQADRQAGRQTLLQFDFGEVLWGSISLTHTHLHVMMIGSGDDDEVRSTWSGLLLR